MSKGLYHCSRCKKHFYDHEATAMHIKDKHKGDGEVLRHPTKKELLVRVEQQADRIKALEETLRKLDDEPGATVAEHVAWDRTLARHLPNSAAVVATTAFNAALAEQEKPE